MICKQCNNNVPNDSEYCPFCGNVVEKKIVQDEVVSEIEKGYTYLELKDWKKAKDIFDFAIVNNDNKAKAYIGRLLAKLKLSDLKELSSVNKELTKFDDFKLAIKYADEDYKQQLKKYCSFVEEKINQKKAKTKKIISISSISITSIVLLLTLTYFVFIPLVRYNYYDKLLEKGNIEKATKSYSNSKWFKYDEKSEELFYDQGVLFVKNKDYKNAEFCFKITGNFKDSKNYYNYCKAQNLLAKNDLESYNYFTKCKDFLDSKNILETNECFVLVNKLQGEWNHPRLETDISFGSIISAEETISIKGSNVLGRFTKGKLIALENNQIAIDGVECLKIRIVSDNVIYIQDDLFDEIKWERE